MNLYFTWNVTPEIIEGWKTPNLYGLMFITGLILGYFVVKKMFKRENMSEDSLDKLVMYMVIATVVGARLGHVLFYGPYWDSVDQNGMVEHGYFSHPLDILKINEGGLASHGGVIAILIALYFYSKKVVHKPMLWILDRIAAPGAIGAAFIRFGNLMNSEIVGDPTNRPWAISFPHYFNETTMMYDATPRHPAQLYEALSYLLIFGIMLFLFYKRNLYLKPGKIFGWFLILLFTARFLVEFVKLGQTARDYELFLNTGQLLSIPFILVGMYFAFRPQKLGEN